MQEIPDKVGHLVVQERRLAQLKANAQTQYECGHSNQQKNSVTNLITPKHVPIDFISLSWT